MSNITIKDSKYLHKFAKFSLRRLIGEIWIFFLIFKTHRNCPTKLSLPCVLLYMCVAITIWHLNQPWNIITQLSSQRQQPSVYLIYSWEDIFHHHNNNNNGNVNCNNHHLRVFALMPIVCAVLNDLIRQREMRNFYFFLCLLLCHSSVFTFFYEYFLHNSELTQWVEADIDYDDSLRLYADWLTELRWWDRGGYCVTCGSDVTLKKSSSQIKEIQL